MIDPSIKKAVVAKLKKGKSPKVVAEAHGISLSTVSRLKRRRKKTSARVLADRPEGITEALRAIIRAEVRRAVRDLAISLPD